MNASIPFDQFDKSPVESTYGRKECKPCAVHRTSRAFSDQIPTVPWRQSGFLTLVQVTSLFIGKHIIIINMVGTTSSSYNTTAFKKRRDYECSQKSVHNALSPGFTPHP